MINHVRIVTGELEENCYIAWADGSREAVVFDPGADAPVLRAEIVGRNLTVGAFLLTHCHGDHIGALAALKAGFPDAPVYCPIAEVEWLARPTLNLSYFFGHAITAPPPEKTVSDGDVLRVCGIEFTAFNVPGHSPGSTAYFVAATESEDPLLFDGDILFAGSIGRTDLPGGEGEAVLVAGIREKLFPLPDATRVLPGHGDATSIGVEKLRNPYCGMDADE
jgi:hydroxyacylglutathione hydrolase